MWTRIKEIVNHALSFQVPYLHLKSIQMVVSSLSFVTVKVVAKEKFKVKKRLRKGKKERNKRQIRCD
mgnify:CR=1 FL=1